MFTCLQINLWSRLPCIHLGQQFSQHHGRLCGVVHPERAASPAREEVVAGARELVADVKSLGSLGANKTAKHVNANLLRADVDEDIRTPVESAEGQLAWPARLHALDGRPGQQRELVEEEGRGAALGAREVHAHGTSLSDQHCLVLYAKPPCSIDECLLGNIQDLRHLSGTPLFHHVRLPSLSFESDETARVFTIPEDIVALPSDGVERGPGSDERLARQRAQQSPKPLLKRPRAGVADSSAERHRYPTLKKLHQQRHQLLGRHIHERVHLRRGTHPLAVPHVQRAAIWIQRAVTVEGHKPGPGIRRRENLGNVHDVPDLSELRQHHLPGRNMRRCIVAAKGLAQGHFAVQPASREVPLRGLRQAGRNASELAALAALLWERQMCIDETLGLFTSGTQHFRASLHQVKNELDEGVLPVLPPPVLGLRFLRESRF
mmetsp:Transcript_94088/g.302786  ORF Transcript_94088/g.302786 Transcript_94088/m.302786 type:complete len:434 (-) Transcript_94088:49-1350(-)